MIQRLINDIRTYFEAKVSLTPEEKRILAQLQAGHYPISTVHRKDLQAKGFDTRKISDDQMEELADQMSEDYLEQTFWVSLELIADGLGFPRYPCCPNCGNKNVNLDSARQLIGCQACGQIWHENLFVLVDSLDEVTCLKNEFSCYCGQSGKYYISEYDYIKYY